MSTDRIPKIMKYLLSLAVAGLLAHSTIGLAAQCAGGVVCDEATRRKVDLIQGYDGCYLAGQWWSFTDGDYVAAAEAMGPKQTQCANTVPPRYWTWSYEGPGNVVFPISELGASSATVRFNWNAKSVDAYDNVSYSLLDSTLHAYCAGTGAAMGDDGACYCPVPYSWDANTRQCINVVDKVVRSKSPCESRTENPLYPLNGRKTLELDLGIAIGKEQLKLSYDTSRYLPMVGATRLINGSFSSIDRLPRAFDGLWFTQLHRRVNIQRPNSGAYPWSVRVLREDGQSLTFMHSNATTYSAFTPDTVEKLVPELVSGSPTSRLLYTDKHGNVESYDSHGITSAVVADLARIDYVDGGYLAFTYAAGRLLSVTDDSGRALTIQYDTASRVKSLTTPDGRSLAFAYDANGILASVTWPDGKSRTYLHENPSFPWAVTGVVDENGVRLFSFTYDTQGRAIESQYANGAMHYSILQNTPSVVNVSESWDAASRTLTRTYMLSGADSAVVTLPGGDTATITGTTINGLALATSQSQPAGSGCAASTNASSYDANGNVLSRDDFQGKRTCYVYDASNREVARVEGLANTLDCSSVTPAGATLPAGARKIATAWHEDWRLPIKVAQPGSLANTVYHGQPDSFNGGAIANCTPAGNLPNGKPIPVVCKQVRQATLDVGGASPSTVDSSYDKVSLLLHADGTNGSKSFVDSSGSPKTAAVSGNAAISTVQSKFGGASAYFDGASASYVSFPPSTIVGAGDLTIEGWIHPTATTLGTVYSNFSGTGSSLLYFGNTQLVWYYNGNSNFSSPANSVPVNQWTHFALVRSGTTCSIYVNGGSVASATCSAAIGTTATDFRLGNTTWSSIPYKGYLDDIRVTLGQARYTASFVPSSSPFGGSNIDAGVSNQVSSYTYDAAGRVLTAKDALNRTTSYSYYTDISFSGGPSGPIDPYYDQVTLLLHGNGSDGSTVFTDSSPASVLVSASGTAKISSARNIFGGSSIYFDGTASCLSSAAANNWALGSGDFTVELWYQPVALKSSRLVTSRLTQGGAAGTWAFNVNATALSFSEVVVGEPGVSGAFGFSAGVWYHLAASRSAGTLRLFVNGVQVASAGNTTNFSNASYPLSIGCSPSENYLNGYIDDVRITKGRARYNVNFTPPAAEFPNQGVVPTPTDIGHTIGDLQSITNPAGHVTQFTLYDRAGRVRQMIDPKGVVTDITYTPRGWVSTVTATAPGGAPRITSYSYDGVGQLTGVTQPDGSTLSYRYDAAHRLEGVTDAKGNSVNYVLDHVGNRIAEEIKDPSGVLQRSISRSFDALNRLQQVTGAPR